MSKYDDVVSTIRGPMRLTETRANLFLLGDALASIDARLSALEAAQKKPDANTSEQREPGLYVVQLLNDLYGIRRWSQKGGWLTQSGYENFEKDTEYKWIGPRIPEPGE